MPTERYRLRSWQRLREDGDCGDRPFARHLRELARPGQIAFQRLMSAYGGCPVGIELRARTRDAWAFVLPDVSGDAAWRIQRFDEDGFSGHMCHSGLTEAVEALISEGYHILDVGALDRCAATSRWASGVRRQQARERFNRGEVSWSEMLELFAQADATIAA